MHGIVFQELRKYAFSKGGEEVWNTLLTDAGIQAKSYVPIKSYPDEELIALVKAASTRMNLPIGSILEDFGSFIVPDLLSVYGSVIDPSWRTLDVIHNTESTIHTVVRQRNPNAAPPVLSTDRKNENHVVIYYASARKFCLLGVGICKGIAKHFGEEIDISQSSCMLSGADHCDIHVKLKVAGDTGSQKRSWWSRLFGR